MRSTLILAFTLAIVAIAAGQSAYATTVTNVTTDTLLFSDDYEGLVTAVSRTSAPDTSGDYDPEPAEGMGSWFIGESDPYQAQVTDSTDGFDPGANEKYNYLRLRQTGNFNNYRAILEEQQETAGDHIHFESMFYYHTESTTRTDVSLASLMCGGSLVNFIYAGNYGEGYGGHIHNRTGAVGDWGTDTGLTFELDTWNYVAIDYMIGASTYSLTINDASVAGLPTWYSDMTGVYIDAVRLSSTPDVTVYHDMVQSEEPGPIPGDADENGIVNAADAATLAANWQGTDKRWSQGDFNWDGVVDDLDATLLAANWQTTATASVPEPTALALLLGIGVTLLLLWRK